MVPQHVDDAADQAAKRIITTRTACDGKMLRLQDTDPRSLRGLWVLGWRTSVRPAGASRALCRLGPDRYPLNSRDRLTFGSRLAHNVGDQSLCKSQFI